ncbi:MAG: tRNA (adenosine(37)-N6)-threonylcarbamoyltransferase complex dimerization subunit type 1 TsaB [Oscillospiraceae bacterium]|nr:tRNA (adenosine(37)-N6)-threonylcarbamoyltransferase complex dimerization subunit type 1 TsaB [Oscillospiraceae bacterium]
MLILAFESSAKPASVAVYCDDKLLGQYFQNNGFSHSRTLMAMTSSLLSNLDLKASDLDLIAVASGPGSFTGVRIGVSAAKGLALGADIPICGVSTLEAMAYQSIAHDVIICPVMDARRAQVYNALFEWKNNSLIRLCEDRAISLDDLVAELKGYDKPCRPVGDGTDLLLAKKQDINILTPCSLTKYQTAYGVALAALKAEPVTAAQLEPFYLRPSQAERERSIL